MREGELREKEKVGEEPAVLSRAQGSKAAGH